MKNLKKVAAVLAAAMAMNAVAVTGAFSASAADDADIIANVSLKGQMGGYQYWGAKVMKETQTTSPAHRLRSQMKMVSTLQPGTSQVTVPAQSNS